SLRAEMKFVVHEQLRPRLSVWPQRNRLCSDVLQPGNLAGVFPYHSVQRLTFLLLFPPGNARAQRDVSDLRVRQLLTNFDNEGSEIRENQFGRFPSMNIVPTGSKQNHSGYIGKDDSFGEVRRVSNLGTSKATVCHLVLRKITCQSLPEA